MADATCTATKDAQRKREELTSLTGRFRGVCGLRRTRPWSRRAVGMKGVRGEKGVGEKGNGRETEQVGVKMRRGLGTDARSCRSARWASARASCWLLLRGVSGEGCKHVTPRSILVAGTLHVAGLPKVQSWRRAGQQDCSSGGPH